MISRLSWMMLVSIFILQCCVSHCTSSLLEGMAGEEGLCVCVCVCVCVYVCAWTQRVDDLFRELSFNKHWQPFRDHLPFIWSTRLGPAVKLHSDRIIVPRQPSDSKKTQNQYFTGKDSYFRNSGSDMQQSSIHPSIIVSTWFTMQSQRALDFSAFGRRLDIFWTGHQTITRPTHELWRAWSFCLSETLTLTKTKRIELIVHANSHELASQMPWKPKLNFIISHFTVSDLTSCFIQLFSGQLVEGILIYRWIMNNK